MYIYVQIALTRWSELKILNLSPFVGAENMSTVVQNNVNNIFDVDISFLISYKRKFNLVKRNMNGNLLGSFIFLMNSYTYDFCSSFSVNALLPAPL